MQPSGAIRGITLKRVKMKIWFAPILATALVSTVAAQDVKEFLGRWDMTVTPATGKPYPQWMELTDKDGKIEGRFQPRAAHGVQSQAPTSSRASLPSRWAKGRRARRLAGCSPLQAQGS